MLVNDWCQQYPSHSVGTVAFGPDGALYAGGGDGASFDFVDWGQDGNPVNPCGDPPGGAGGPMTPPTAEGGALRSQDIRTLQSDPSGASIAVGGEAQAAPYTRRVIQGATVSLIADSPQTLGGKAHDFASWSDRRAGPHDHGAGDRGHLHGRVHRAPCSTAGLVGAWGFEEAGGATAADSSGTGNAGTITGAARTPAGRHGSALSFDGDDIVNVPDSASLDLTTAATISAWVYPTALGNAWRTAVFKAGSGNLAYALYAHTDKGSPNGELYTAGEQVVDGTAPLPLHQWSYLTMTWDGATQRLYVGTTEVASRATTGTLVDGSGPLSFGGNGVWSEWFAGKLDDIRVYDRALTASAVAAGMASPVACAAAPEPQPVLSVSKGSLSFTAIQGGADPASQTVDIANAGTGTLAWTAAESSPWLAVGPASGNGPGTLTVTPSAGGLAAGTYTAAVTIASAGAAGSPKTVDVTLRVDPPPPAGPPPPAAVAAGPPSPPAAGPVGAWGFDEPKGATARDASGSGNPGRLSGPARVTSGRFGPALSFDGVNDFVSVADDPSLDLTNAATLEAWVYPTALGGRWRTVLFKERTGRLSYGLYAHAGAARPRGYLFPAGRGEQALAGPAALPLRRWSHLAMTWDGATQRLFVDGDQVAARAQGGTLAGGKRPLRIGGNTIWSEWFRGRIDEVRVYDRALTRAELAADMSTPVSGTGAAPAVRALEKAQARAERSYGSRRARLRAIRRARRAGYRHAAKLRTRREWAAMRARRLAIR